MHERSMSILEGCDKSLAHAAIASILWLGLVIDLLRVWLALQRHTKPHNDSCNTGPVWRRCGSNGGRRLAVPISAVTGFRCRADLGARCGHVHASTSQEATLRVRNFTLQDASPAIA